MAAAGEGLGGWPAARRWPSAHTVRSPECSAPPITKPMNACLKVVTTELPITAHAARAVAARHHASTVGHNPRAQSPARSSNRPPARHVWRHGAAIGARRAGAAATAREVCRRCQRTAYGAETALPLARARVFCRAHAVRLFSMPVTPVPSRQKARNTVEGVRRPGCRHSTAQFNRHPTSPPARPWPTTQNAALASYIRKFHLAGGTATRIALSTPAHHGLQSRQRYGEMKWQAIR